MSDFTSRFVQFAKPFIESQREVFKTMVHADVIAKSPALKKQNISNGDYSFLMGMTGLISRPEGNVEFRGMLVLSFPEQTYLKVASGMLMEEYSKYSPEIADVGSEIINMIMGNAKRTLSEIGYKIDMAIPTAITGLGHLIQYPPNTKIVEIMIDSALGSYFMDLCYRDV